MSKITKKELQYQINGLAAEASTRHNSIMRIHRALASIGVDIFSDDFDLAEPEPQPQLKQLDQSVFNGLDEKWRFAAVDLDGESWVYREQPKIDKGDDRWSASNTPPNSIGTGYDVSNWQNSLIERDIAKELLEVDLSSELTGSELCKAMLARGDTHIMCKVYDDGSRNDITHVIRAYSDGKFHTKANRWSYAVPINNQGEPLTASEAGL